MKLLLVGLTAGLLSGNARAQCEAPPIDGLFDVATFGGMEGGRLTFTGYGATLRTYDIVDGDWVLVDSYTPPSVAVLPQPFPLGIVRDSTMYFGASRQGTFSSGEIHIREGNGPLKILTADDLQFGDAFGETLALSGDVMAVGAIMSLYGTYWSPTGPGKSYVFEHDGSDWNQVARFDAHSYGNYLPTGYGISIDTDGETMVVGAPYEDSDPHAPIPSGPGAVYVYEKGASGWTEVAKLFEPNPQRGAAFGRSVLVRGDQIYVGTPDDLAPSAPGREGSVVLFDRSAGGWTAGQTLTDAAGIPGDWLGSSLAISGDRLVVGAPGVDGFRPNAGAAVLFERDASGAWGQVDRFEPKGPDTVNAGIDVFIEGNLLGWTNIGSPRVEIVSLGIEEIARTCTSTPNSTGAAATLIAAGCDSRIANNLTLEASPLPANAVGIFFFGSNAAQYPFGNGFMCIGAGRRRLGLNQADGGGVMRATLDFESPQARAIQAGATYFFQAYFRDSGTGAGFDFSDALEIGIRN